MPHNSTVSVFISYSRRDLPFVADLVQGLRSRGIETWVDLARIPPADNWKESITQALIFSSHFILVVSPAALESKNVLEELSYAVDHRMSIVPVLLQDAILPESLNDIEWIDFRIRFREPLNRLVAYLRGDLELFNVPDDPPPKGYRVAWWRWMIDSPVCPQAVSVINGALAFSGVGKAFLGLLTLLSAFLQFAATSTAVIDSSYLDYFGPFADLIIAAGFFFVFGLVEWAYAVSAQSRWNTLQEMTFLAGFQLALPLILFANGLLTFSTSGIGWFNDIREFVVSLAACDGLAAVGMVIARGYKRWMPAYSIGVKWLIRYK